MTAVVLTPGLDVFQVKEAFNAPKNDRVLKELAMQRFGFRVRKGLCVINVLSLLCGPFLLSLRAGRNAASISNQDNTVLTMTEAICRRENIDDLCRGNDQACSRRREQCRRYDEYNYWRKSQENLTKRKTDRSRPARK